jgi:hypothetical protein
MEELLEVGFLCGPCRDYIKTPSGQAQLVCSESEYEVGMRWSPDYEDVSSEVEDRLPSEAVTE